MNSPGSSPLRIAVVGGGPAGSFFALYALKYAREACRPISVTIYEGKDFRNLGPPGCNMCAGIVPVSYLAHFRDLGLVIPPDLILSRVSSYSLHTPAGTLHATQPDVDAEIISVYRGGGPRPARYLGSISFDELLLEEAVERGATLRRAFADEIRRGPPVEVSAAGEIESYDLVVLATGVNGHPVSLPGYRYRLPTVGAMCQTELFLGTEEVNRRVGSSVHIFLCPDDIAEYGILIPKGPFVTVSLLKPSGSMSSLRRFLAQPEVEAILGDQPPRACGCLPQISLGMAKSIADDGFVAIGDASATRLYKNGIGSALQTAERAAWTAVYRGPNRSDFAADYLPHCRAIHTDNLIGRLMFLQVPMMKRFRAVSMAHCRLALSGSQYRKVHDLHIRILWGMFTGAYSYRELLRMAVHPGLALHLGMAFGRSVVERAEMVRLVESEKALHHRPAKPPE